jgi:hypothetical protein
MKQQSAKLLWLLALSSFAFFRSAQSLLSMFGNFGKTQVDCYVIIAPQHPFIATVSVFAKIN